MADRPPPLRLSRQARRALAEHRAGRIPAEVALMRLMLSGLPAARVAEAAPDLATLAARHEAGLGALERMVRAGADHGAGTGLAATRAMFDRLVAISPEASVAAWSLGDPALLEAATADFLGWLRGRGLLAGRPVVLDLGCGIGRIAAAVAPEAGFVLGLDISEAMLAVARARHAGVPRLAFAAFAGRALPLADGGVGLVLAVDVFPYLVQAGEAVAAGMLAEVARVLRPGGHAIIVNAHYGDARRERSLLARLAAGRGLAACEAATRPCKGWDGRAFRLRRSGLAGDGGL